MNFDKQEKEILIAALEKEYDRRKKEEINYEIGSRSREIYNHRTIAAYELLQKIKRA